MSWAIRQRLYIDLAQWGAGHLLDMEGGVAKDRSGSWVVRLADCFMLQLCFVDRSISNTALVSLPAGSAIIVAGKLLTNGVPSGSLLFSADTFAAFTDGGVTGYEAELDANTAAFASAMSGEDSIEIQLDVEIQNAGNTRRLTLVVPCQGRPQSYAGEGSPTPAEPVYPAPESLITTGQFVVPAGYRLVVTVEGTITVEQIT